MAHCGPLRLAIIHLLENIIRLTEYSVEWADLESEVLPAMFTRIIQSFDLDFLHRLAATVEDGIPPRTFLHIVAALATPGDVTDVAHSASLLGYTHSGFVFSNLRTTIEDPTSWEHDTGFICPYAIDQPPTQAVVVFKREEMFWKMVMVAPVPEQVCQAHLYEMVAVMKHCRRAKFPIELEPTCLDNKAIEPYLFLSRGVHQLCADKDGGEHDSDIKCEMVKLATSGLCRVKQTAVALTPASTTHTPEPHPPTPASPNQDPPQHSQGDTFPQSRKRKVAISNLGEDTLGYQYSESEYAPEEDEEEDESDPQYYISASSDEEDHENGTDDNGDEKDLDARLAEDDREKRALVQSAWVPGARQLISHNILVKQLNGHFAGSGKDFTDGTEFSNVICDNLEIPRESAFKQIQALGLKDGTSIVIGRRKSDTVTESAYMFQERSVMGEAFDQLDLEFAYVLGVATGLRLESIRVRVFRVACKSRRFPTPPNMRSDLDIGRALTAMGKGFDSPNANNASKATEVMENLITPTGAGIALLCFHIYVLGRYEAFLEWLGS
ncbi:hypothetical protein LTR10_010335 [Elasticomyces elasticus]|nr:hypothetical protein LTR10_010335 [Elasticomyces elasticus]